MMSEDLLVEWSGYEKDFEIASMGMQKLAGILAKERDDIA
jgi:hypothetical protein